MKGLPRWLLVLFSILLVSCVGLLTTYFVLSGRDSITFNSKNFLQGTSEQKENSIFVLSDIPGISIKLVNKDEISKFLEEINFWEESGVRIYETASLVTVNNLEIHLTDKEQEYGQFTGGDSMETYQSFGQSLENDKLKIYVHFSFDKIHKIIEQESFGKLSFNIFHSLYLSSAKAVENKDEIKATDFAREYLDSKPASESIVKISKKISFNILTKLLSLLSKPVYAQCSGDFACGVDIVNCVCSDGVNHDDCVGTGDRCGVPPNTCTCTTDCSNAAQFNCVDRRNNVYICENEGGCGMGYDCVNNYECSWDGPTPVPTIPGSTPAPTSPPAGCSCAGGWCVNPASCVGNVEDDGGYCSGADEDCCCPFFAGTRSGRYGISFFYDADRDGNWDSGESSLKVNYPGTMASIRTIVNIPNVAQHTYVGGWITNNICIDEAIVTGDSREWAYVCPNPNDAVNCNGCWIFRPIKQGDYWVCAGSTNGNCIGQLGRYYYRSSLGLSTNNVDILDSKDIKADNRNNCGFSFIPPPGWEVTRIKWNSSYYPSSNVGTQIHESAPGATGISTNLENPGAFGFKMVGRVIHVGVAQAMSCVIDLPPPPDYTIGGTGLTVGVFPAISTTGGDVDQVLFISDNVPVVATVCARNTGPCPDVNAFYLDDSSSFSADLTSQGISPPAGTLTAVATMSDGTTTCTDTANINVLNPPAWWQAVGGSIVAGSEYISSVIPANCSLLPGCVPFIVAGEGMPIAGTTITSGAGGPSESG
ncbi:hypothetical protein KKB40_05460, partial [Patescibacteria group bacterium]|nr:hypothetical protein [Patescibacteria group bacterium]